MNQNAIYYIAGLLEGEATFSSTKTSRYMELSMTDEDTVNQAYELSGRLGSVRGPYVRENKKPFWVWHVSDSKELARLLCAIAPLMSLRRREAIMCLADKLSRLSKCMIARPCEVCGAITVPKSIQSAVHRRSAYCSTKHRDTINNRRRYGNAGINS